MSRSPSSLSPAALAALHDAWWRNGGALADFPAALASHPPRIGSAGWPRRWALAARAALAAAEAAARAAAGRAYWAAEQARNDSPVWGVIREYGAGHFSNAYGYGVGFGAGKMSRAEAEAAAKAAYANDAAAQDHKRFWDEFMRS